MPGPDLGAVFLIMRQMSDLILDLFDLASDNTKSKAKKTQKVSDALGPKWSVSCFYLAVLGQS